MTEKAARNAGTTARNQILQEMLNGRRREIEIEVQNRIRGARTQRMSDVRDDLEHADADIQGDLDLALLQLRAESLTRIDEALLRLEAGTYGFCFECEEEIADSRLRAMPFAVRCRACEQRREDLQGHARQRAQRCAGLSLFPDVASS